MLRRKEWCGEGSCNRAATELQQSYNRAATELQHRGMVRRKECCVRGEGQVSDKLQADEARHLHRCITALCNRERVENHSTSGHCVIGFLLLILASAHRQLAHSVKNILRSPTSKEGDAGGGRNGHHARQSFADLPAGVCRRRWWCRQDLLVLTCILMQNKSWH
jgi:hypothetical protein